MRKLLIVIIGLVFLYAGSAVVAMVSLAGAVERGDGAAILARTDQVAVRRSIVSQVLEIYFEGRQPTARSRMLAQTVGATIADAMVEKFMTAENIASLLRDGKVSPTEQTPEISINLARLSSDDVMGLLNRFRLSGIRRFAIRLSDEKAGDDYAEVLMEFQPLSWQLVGLRLPKRTLQEFAAKLPAKQ